MENETITADSALIMLGCPEVPVQTSAAIYLLYSLQQKGIATTVAGTRAAMALLEVADPGQHYLGDRIDLDQCIAAVAEGERDFDLCFVFIHNDSGVAYSATMATLSQGTVYAVVFGEDTDELAGEIVEGCERIIAKGRHNPMALKRKLDGVTKWVASKR